MTWVWGIHPIRSEEDRTLIEVVKACTYCGTISYPNAVVCSGCGYTAKSKEERVLTRIESQTALDWYPLGAKDVDCRIAIVIWMEYHGGAEMSWEQYELTKKLMEIMGG